MIVQLSRRSRAQKLERNWGSLYKILKKINDVVYCIGKSSREKEKIILFSLILFIERSIKKVIRQNGRDKSTSN